MNENKINSVVRIFSQRKISSRIVSNDGSLYHISPHEAYTWDEAEEKCQSWFKGHLASVHSLEEYDFLM